MEKKTLFNTFLTFAIAMLTMISVTFAWFTLSYDAGGEIVGTVGTLETAYDFAQIKEVLEEIGALPKAVKLNNSFVDRLVAGNGVNEDVKERIKSARVEISENKSFSVIKPDKK